MIKSHTTFFRPMLNQSAVCSQLPCVYFVSNISLIPARSMITP
jgi:hypothetical protein